METITSQAKKMKSPFMKWLIIIVLIVVALLTFPISAPLLVAVGSAFLVGHIFYKTRWWLLNYTLMPLAAAAPYIILLIIDIVIDWPGFLRAEFGILVYFYIIPISYLAGLVVAFLFPLYKKWRGVVVVKHPRKAINCFLVVLSFWPFLVYGILELFYYLRTS